MSGLRVILVRHGEPVPEARGRCYGRLDVPLRDSGRRQADLVARALLPQGVVAVRSSPRRRAIDTAAPIARAAACALTVAMDLAEMDFGHFEGRSYDEIAATYPDLYRRWMEEPTRVRFPGGEGYADLRARAVGVLDDVRREWREGTVVLVTHGGVCRAILAHLLGMPDDAIFRIDQGYCAANVVDFVEDVPLVRTVNAPAGAPLPAPR